MPTLICLEGSKKKQYLFLASNACKDRDLLWNLALEWSFYKVIAEFSLDSPEQRFIITDVFVASIAKTISSL